MADKQLRRKPKAFTAVQRDAVAYLESLGFHHGDAMRIVAASPYDLKDGDSTDRLNWDEALSRIPGDVDPTELRQLSKCPKCEGTGWLRYDPDFGVGEYKCDDCFGRGEVGALRHSIRRSPTPLPLPPLPPDGIPF